MGLTGKTKQVLDQRLTTLGLERMMRDPKTQRSFRVQKSLFTDEGMTGEDRVQWIFQVPHVLGHKALCLPERLRYPVLEAFSRAQLMIIASRSFRAYNVAELDLIFDQGFKRFFTCMEMIYKINHNRMNRERLRRHRKNPQKYRAPIPFKRQKRYLYACVFMIETMCPHIEMHVSSRLQPYVLTFECMSPHFVCACVLMFETMCPHVKVHVSSCLQHVILSVGAGTTIKIPQLMTPVKMTLWVVLENFHTEIYVCPINIG